MSMHFSTNSVSYDHTFLLHFGCFKTLIIEVVVFLLWRKLENIYNIEIKKLHRLFFGGVYGLTNKNIIF